MTGKQLRKIRRDRGLSVAKAAAMVHVASRTWVRWESEGAPETAAHLLCLLLGLPWKGPKPKGERA